MPYEFKLPDLGEGMAEVEFRAWRVQAGDRIDEHQPVAEVETDKAVVEIPSPRSGLVASLAVGVGDTVRVGDTLMLIADETEIQRERPKSVGIVGELPEAEDEAPKPVLALPAVRKLARERGIDLGSVVGTGVKGQITVEDLERFAAPAAAGAGETGGAVERIPLRGVRKAIARNVLAAQQRTAFVTGMEEADISELWELRTREQYAVESRGSHLTFLPFFIKAAQHALREHPYLNATIDDGAEEILLRREYHFGIAVDTADGLMVPVIRDVERKSIIELAAELQRLSRRASERSLAREELQGGTFTITNYGHFGGMFATPIINWPEVAILGCGRIAERPWVHRGSIAIRRILPLSLTFDHRVTDGADAAQFLVKVVRYLEDPGLLFIESC